MKNGDLIQTLTLDKGIHDVQFEHIYPFGLIEHQHLVSISYYIDDIKQSSQYANRLVIELNQKDKVSFYVGQGYIASKDDDLTERFLNHNGWSGGDGIFSFNMDNGNDSFDQKESAKTLFVFGDTFVGRSDPKTKKRLQPHLMPNNSLAYMKDNQIEFKLNWKEDGSISNFYTIEQRYDYSGSIPFNLVNYDRKEKHGGYLSGYHPKKLEIIFDFHVKRNITHAIVWNYYSDEADFLNKRGIKDFKLYGSHDLMDWDLINPYTLEIASSKEHKQTIQIQSEYRYLKMEVPTVVSIGNHNDEDFDEGLYGLNQIKFYNQNQLYRDVWPTATSTLLKTQEHAWIWLQDGVIINDYLYFIPIIINGDDTQPEGLQFKVVAAALFKTPIKNGVLDIERSTQKIAPILLETKDSNYLFGSALMALTKQSGAVNPDGYIYIYGYKTTFGLRELLVARVEASKFEQFDDWRFYNGSNWTTDLLDAKPLLEHVSCEMSVSPLREGTYKGKYIAVFTYDTNTPYVAFSIGETPWGPFSDPQIIYHTPEQALFKSTTYTYNAKAHPHLSQSKDILVTYNTNTYSFDHNMSDYRVYRARFIHLIDTMK